MAQKRRLGLRVRVGAALAAGAVLAVPAAAAAAETRDDSFAEFAAGSVDAGAAIAEHGSVQLKSTGQTQGFDGPARPAGFTETPLTAGAVATFDSGAMRLDGVRVNSEASYTPEVALEFRATFSAIERQHVGFGDTLQTGPWAIFSTGGNGHALGLYARTGGPTDPPTLVSATVPTGAHTYRIEWSADTVRYFLDGVEVAGHPNPTTTAMKLVASEGDGPGTRLSLDWLTVGGYEATGTFVSRVHEADPRAVWNGVTIADNTGVAFETRVGNVATPDGTWSGWTEPGPGGALDSTGRYLQYRATLTRQANGGTPSLNLVELGYEIDDVAPTASIGEITVGGATATVSFSSPASDIAGYRCRLGDGGAFTACSSPQSFAGLAPGSHVVHVQAVDRAGNVGAAASRSFTVAPPAIVPDTTPPGLGLLTRSAKATAKGDVKLRVRCPAGEVRCRVTLVLKDGRRTAATKTATVLGGTEKVVKLRLASSTRRKLAKRRRLGLKAVVTASDHLGNAKRSAYALRVKA